ncbi:unnamed protein product, partial [Owenia fusiformis]
HVTFKMVDQIFFKFLAFMTLLGFYRQAKLLNADANSCLKRKPNIIFILTDDQDIEIGGTIPIVKTKQLIGDAGITFQNMFVDSPLCCPSRSSILTGRYIHNHNAVNNSINGNCSSPAWQAGAEKKAFSVYLKEQQYTTFFAGKYLNQYGKKAAGGPAHVPPGWDWWNGLVGNSRYYNYKLSVNGTKENHKDDYKTDYLTDVIHRRGIEFLQLQNNDGTNADAKPFFMMLSTPACHAPFTPAPQYSGKFNDTKAPRNGSFNVYGKDKHWLLRAAKHPLSKTSLEYIDGAYRNRWRTLLSVDDIVENVINVLKERKLLENTYIFFSSDNGFHLGQFSLPNDKRQMYDFDIRVPLYVRGPGIKPGQKKNQLIGNIDLAPTFIALANGTVPSEMDGQSFVPLLDSSSSKWRNDFLIEHQGEYGGDSRCPDLKDDNVDNCYPDCVCEDAKNNTYTCVRTLSFNTNLVYCQFSDSESFVEVYDLKKDPYQLNNLAKTIDPKLLAKQNQRLIQLSVCQGDSCRTLEPDYGAEWLNQLKHDKHPHDIKHQYDDKHQNDEKHQFDKHQYDDKQLEEYSWQKRLRQLLTEY